MSKYIFLDIDGTLVDFDNTMPDSAREALLAAQKNGHKIFLCTGRLSAQIYPWLLEAIPFDGIISSSGANVICGGKSVWNAHIPPEKMVLLAKKLREHGAIYCCHTNEHILTRWLPEVYEIFMAKGLTKEEIDPLFCMAQDIDVTAEAAKGVDLGIEKAVYYHADLPLDGMRKALAPDFIIDGYSYGGLPDTCGEITLAGVSKARGIEELTKVLGIATGNAPGIARADTIAVGDGSNDLAMVRWCGVGVAMGNASDELKAAADLVTSPLREDGIARAFHRLGLV
ncbi:MAG: HAD family hydrolase [Clostridia bacterium]|nr:HAD family hydrolase [Clostridia bacterium]